MATTTTTASYHIEYLHFVFVLRGVRVVIPFVLDVRFVDAPAGATGVNSNINTTFCCSTVPPIIMRAIIMLD